MKKYVIVVSTIVVVFIALYVLKLGTCEIPNLNCMTISAGGFTEPSHSFCDYDDAREWVKVVEYKKGEVICLWRE